MHTSVSIVKTDSVMCFLVISCSLHRFKNDSLWIFTEQSVKEKPRWQICSMVRFVFSMLFLIKNFFCHQCWWWVDTYYWSLHCRKSVIAGMTAGAFGQFIASPTDLVKVQMQMEGKRVLVEGRRPRYDVRWLRRIIINPLLPSSYCRACIVADWDYLLLLCAQLWYLLTITQFNL